MYNDLYRHTICCCSAILGSPLTEVLFSNFVRFVEGFVLDNFIKKLELKMSNAYDIYS